MKVVVGGGLIGLSAAYHLVRRGQAVTLIDHGEARPPASQGNAGGIAVADCVPASVPGVMRRVPGWLIDPLGPLHLRPGHAARVLPWLAAFVAAGRIARVREIARALAALNARVYPALEPMLADIGMGAHLHRTGALVVYRDAAARRADALGWELRSAHGVAWEALDRAAIEDLEPAIGPALRCGVLLPDWSIVSDPAAILGALRRHLLEAGVGIVAGEATAILRGAQGAAGAALRDGREVRGCAVVVAAGAWSAALARSAGDRVLLESERGYNMTLPDPGVALTRQVIFGAEHFVATPLSVGLRIGGAAEFAGLRAPANLARAERLVALARRALPGLDARGATPWMGHRPATPDSLPVIGESPRLRGLFYGFGHGHLGLTQSAPTGRILADLILRRDPGLDTAPYSPGRF